MPNRSTARCHPANSSTDNSYRSSTSSADNSPPATAATTSALRRGVQYRHPTGGMPSSVRGWPNGPITQDRPALLPGELHSPSALHAIVFMNLFSSKMANAPLMPRPLAGIPRQAAPILRQIDATKKKSRRNAAASLPLYAQSGEADSRIATAQRQTSESKPPNYHRPARWLGHIRNRCQITKLEIVECHSLIVAEEFDRLNAGHAQ